ncbi:MAG: exo-rhamnogalacturonan lyase family protein, partial [Planctomycetota bacterium]
MTQRFALLSLMLVFAAAPAAPGGEPQVPADAAVPLGVPARKNLEKADFAPGKLKLPLTVVERCGVDREGEVVSGGVPFPPGFLPDVKKLRVVDAAGKPVACQASVMIKWHKPVHDDSVQWALVSFPADVAAGGTSTYFLTDAGGDAPATPLRVVGADGGFTVETGPAKFAVPGKGKALVSEAFFGEEKVIGGEGLRLTAASGDWPDRGLKKGDALAGEVVDAVLEEQGPVRVVLRLKGAFKPGDKDGLHYGFTARLYFTAGSSAVRVILTVDNSRLDPKLVEGWRRVYAWPIEDASLVADLAAGGKARTLAEGKEISLDAGEGELSVYQDSSGGEKWKDLPGGNYEKWLVKYTGGKQVRGVSFRGYRVKTAEGELASGKSHPGVIDACGAKAGLAAALRNFRVEYPSALGASAKRLRVGLFPGEFAEPFHLNTGQRESWDVRLVLHGAKGPDLGKLAAAHDRLLLFRPEPAWMVRAACAGAWPSGLALLRAGRSRPFDKDKLDGIHAGRDWYGWISGWNSGGGHWNQSTCFAPWVLWGESDNFDSAESKALWAGDVTALHYSDEHMPNFWLYLRSWNWRENRLKGATYPGYYNRDTWGLPDSGHMAMFMWLEYYLLTGDMRARESSESLGVRARAFCWQYNHDDRKDGTGPLRGAVNWCKKRDPESDPEFVLYNRYIGWPLYDLSQYYRLTGRPELLAEARTVARSFRNTGRWSPTGFLCCYVNKKGDRGMYGGQGPFGKYRD